MSKDRIRIFMKFLVPELAFTLIATAGIWAVCYFKQMPFAHTLKAIVMTVLGIAVTGFRVRREYFRGDIPYVNRMHIDRFWLGMLYSLLFAFACAFLPKAGWPFPAVFVMLSLYSTPAIGVMASATALMIPVMLGGASADIFFLYLVSGIFAASLFCPLEEDSRFALPLALSMMCLLLCETADIILVANARPKWEMFVVPAVNIILSAVLLAGILKLFAQQALYWFRDKYLELNDTESPLLAQLRESDRGRYMKAIHITYFTERLAGRLSMDVDAVKCASYYHVFGEEVLNIMEEWEFPPRAREILVEYFTHRNEPRKNPIRHKEAAVIFCSNAVIELVLPLAASGGKADYDAVIDELFQSLMDRGFFDDCDITIRELGVLHNIYKEEKLYYDFLR